MKGRTFFNSMPGSLLLSAKSFQPDFTQSQNIFTRVFEIIVMANCAGYLIRAFRLDGKSRDKNLLKSERAAETPISLTFLSIN